MNNPQRGFIMPLLVALVAVLLIGGGTYVYVQSKKSNSSITVTYPNGGEQFVLGKINFKTTWVSSNLSGNVRISLTPVPANFSGCRVGIVPASQGYFNVEIGPDYRCPNGVTPVPGKYTLRVEPDDILSYSTFAAYIKIGDSSDSYFTITSPVETKQQVQSAQTTLNSTVQDTDIRAILSAVQAQAEIYYDGDGGRTYGVTAFTSGGVCGASAVAKALTAAQMANGGITPICNSSAQAYAVSSPFFSDRTKFWCVDSTGSNVQTATPLGTNTKCK